MLGLEADPTGGRLSRRDAVFRVFDSVIDRIADEMHQGIGDRLDDGLVDLGFFPDELQFDLLLLFAREVPDEAEHLPEGARDRNHANAHRDVLDRACDAVELQARLLEILEMMSLEIGIVGHHRLGQDQLADEVHQGVELLEIDADIAGRGLPLLVLVPSGSGRPGSGGLLRLRRRNGGGRSRGRCPGGLGVSGGRAGRLGLLAGLHSR